MTDLEVSHINVRFGKFDAVKDVSLSIPSGGALGLVGESGSGKTTVARAIVGLHPATSGCIRLGEELLPRTRSREQFRRIQMVYQDPYTSLNPRMTIRNMLSEVLRLHRIVPRNRVRQRCTELMDMVQLSESSLDAYPSQFSGGQRQRIALARALALAPQVLVADEPTSALDASVQSKIVDLLATLRSELQLTLVCVSHDLAVVAALCDSVAVMKDGKIIENSPKNEFFSHPSNDYSRNLLAAVPRLPSK
ncbi:ABC transporter ATP-binding protein [Actinomycetaceae bacterium WB03_NA08]|uniref:ABC transporter ATP-binding protein n=1 Tax=Scrofimicrobium canadense TaxID=2652290 RepID=A0A6N7VUK4_9ACTO|nr:ABC transporter ATP-binding protein [Scrofimicrobium canadense]MSS84660.1 ABC transporter ATP-binding protein [Scrofimicrobium canadense]